MTSDTTATEARARMSAIVSRTYGPTASLRIEQVDRPIPGDHQILVRNHASVVTKAMCEARSGRSLMTRLYFGLRNPKWPILGTNFAKNMTVTAELAANGALVPVVGATYPMEHTAAAYQLVEDGRKVGSTVITVCVSVGLEDSGTL